MMDELQNITVNLMGFWVVASCFSGLLIFLVIKFFDLLFPNQSSSDKYHKSVASLVFFFLLNLSFTYYVYDYDVVENQTSFFVENKELSQPLNKSVVYKDVGQVFDPPETSIKDFLISSMLIKSLGIFWLIGALVFTIKLLGGYFYIRSIILHNQQRIPDRWNAFIQGQLAHLKIKKRVRVFENHKIYSAFTLGFLRPIIVLPLGFFTTLPPEQIEAVLLHEIYHIRRKDYLINLLTMTFEVLFFYHPLMWWLAKNICAERENSCDDQVTQVLDKKVYAHALLSMESYRQSLNYAIPFSNKQSKLKIRIMRIFEQKPEKNLGVKPFLGLLIVVFSLMSFTFYQLEESTDTSGQDEIAVPYTQAEELESTQVKKEKVFFKAEFYKLGLVLQMTKQTLIAKSEKDIAKLYIDEKLHPLNELVPIGRNSIATMYRGDEGSSFHFFSEHYFKSHDRDRWIKKHENRDSYIFNSEAESFVFRLAKNPNQHH